MAEPDSLAKPSYQAIWNSLEEEPSQMIRRSRIIRLLFETPVTGHLIKSMSEPGRPGRQAIRPSEANAQIKKSKTWDFFMSNCEAIFINLRKIRAIYEVNRNFSKKNSIKLNKWMRKTNFKWIKMQFLWINKIWISMNDFSWLKILIFKGKWMNAEIACPNLQMKSNN